MCECAYMCDSPMRLKQRPISAGDQPSFVSSSPSLSLTLSSENVKPNVTPSPTIMPAITASPRSPYVCVCVYMCVYIYVCSVLQCVALCCSVLQCVAVDSCVGLRQRFRSLSRVGAKPKPTHIQVSLSNVFVLVTSLGLCSIV